MRVGGMGGAKRSAAHLKFAEDLREAGALGRSGTLSTLSAAAAASAASSPHSLSVPSPSLHEEGCCNEAAAGGLTPCPPCLTCRVRCRAP